MGKIRSSSLRTKRERERERDELAYCLNAGGMRRIDGESETFVTHSLRADGFDASEDGTGRGTPIVPVSTFQNTGQGWWNESDIAQSVRTPKGAGSMEANVVAFRAFGQEGFTPSDQSPPIASTDGGGAGVPTIAFSCKDSGADAGDTAPTLRAMEFDGSHANGGGQVAVVFDTTQVTSSQNRSNPQSGDPCHPLAAGAHAPAVAFNLRGRDGGAMPEIDQDGLAAIRSASGGSSRTYAGDQVAVRRLTPVECSRLQGFEDSYTAIPYNGKPAADGPQYRALGNSWAIPCVSWIAARIEAVDRIMEERK